MNAKQKRTTQRRTTAFIKKFAKLLEKHIGAWEKESTTKEQILKELRSCVMESKDL